MASLRTQRFGSSISWSFQFATRSRSVAFSFSSAERRRSRHHRSRPLSHHQFPSRRTFSTESTLYQDIQPSTSNSRTGAPHPSTTQRTAPAPGQKATHSNATASQVPREPPPPTARNISNNPPQEPIRDVTQGLSDMPAPPKSAEQVDWTNSFHGLSAQPFSTDASQILLAPINVDDIEIKPDGITYLPEIKYRRILNRAFGPGGWGLAPRGETIVTSKAVTREYALLAHGRLVSVARGEQDYFDGDGIPTATEGCKSNALMRCCKDLGVASELWDPRFLRNFLKQHSKEIWVEHVVTKKKRKITLRKDDEPRYPYQESKTSASGRF